MDKLGISLGMLIVQILAFTIVFLTLNAWVYQPMLNLMATRKKKIEQGLSDARVAADARLNAEKEAAQVLAAAHAEAGKIVREATERASVAAKDVKAAAETDAAKVRESALAEAEMERSRVLGDLRGQVAALAIAAAQKLVGDTLDEKRQRALIDEFFSGVAAGKLVVLTDGALKGDSAEVISALPLEEKERETVKRDILSRAGAKEVSFRVDPTILGGLQIKLGDKIVDGSVAGRLEALRQSMR